MQNLSYRELSDLLGVRAPLLMLDRLSADVLCGKAEGTKVVSMDECHFAGHFPGQPVMPGVLLVACICQAAQALIELEGKGGDCVPVLSGLKRVKFRLPVRPGMVLTVLCTKGAVHGDGGMEFSAKILADGQVACSGTVIMAMAPSTWYSMAPEDLEPSPLDGELVNMPFLRPEELMEIIPHRPPFMLLDRAYGMGHTTCMTGIKNVTGSGVYVNASVPEHFPGYFMIESAAQLGCAGVLARPGEAGKIGLFMSIDEAVFHGAAMPGMRLVFRLECETVGRFGIAAGRTYGGSRLLAEYTVKFAIVTKDEASGSASADESAERRS